MPKNPTGLKTLFAIQNTERGTLIFFGKKSQSSENNTQILFNSSKYMQIWMERRKQLAKL